MVKSHFLFEVHPPQSKTDEQDAFILLLSSLITQMAQVRLQALPDEMLGGTETALELCSSAQRYFCLHFSYINISATSGTKTLVDIQEKCSRFFQFQNLLFLFSQNLLW